jgi:hypothetical protein
MDRDVGRVDFRVGLGTLEDRVKRQSLRYLKLNVRRIQDGDVGCRLVRKPQDVGLVKL